MSSEANSAARIFPRVEMDIVASYESAPGERQRCTAIDLSVGGACLETTAPFPDDELVEMLFELDEDWAMPTHARKIWERADHDRILVGVEHKPTRSSDRQLLGPWIHKMRKLRRSGALPAAENEQEAFDAALQLILQRMKPDRAAVFYGMDEGGLLQARATHGLDPSTMYTTEQLSHAVLFELLSARKPQIVIDTLTDPRFGSRSSVVLSGIKSAIGCPLISSNGTPSGLLYADRLDSTVSYRQGHLAWFEELRDELTKKLTSLSDHGRERRGSFRLGLRAR